jgi:benzoate-CoA ligase family protein
MTIELPEALNIADRFLDARVREGKADKTALIQGERRLTYREVQAEANRVANVLASLSVDPEQRVLIGLPDIPEFATTLFGALKNGSAVVMVNSQLKPDEIRYFYDYTRAKVAVVHAEQLPAFAEAADGARDLKAILVVGEHAGGGIAKSLAEAMAAVQPERECYPTHRDDPAIWLFSGGTTGRPKAVIQTHGSFANTTELYGKGVLGFTESDVTLSVPKLYFGYATGANLLFPFSVGGTSILFPERCTADLLFEQIRRHRPSILINVPTMVNHMVSHPAAKDQDLSCLRLSTSAGEALPVELYERWRDTFGVELLDGLGTAEMWHVFISNRPGDVTPGTLGKVVPGFDVRVRDDEGRDLPDGEVGWLWVRGASRAIAYWHHMDKTQSAFRGEWYVSGDMLRRNPDGTFVYCGRGDDMLKVGGKWLAPGEVENCLLTHPRVKEAAVVGVVDEAGLVKPQAFVVLTEPDAEIEEELKEHVRQNLEPYKAPRRVVVMDSLPTTHLGKVDRGKLRRG